MADRVAENVAIARIRVPPAVASEAIVLVSAIAGQASARIDAAPGVPYGCLAGSG